MGLLTPISDLLDNQPDAFHECRICGTNLSGAVEECRHCGSTEIARYEL